MKLPVDLKLIKEGFMGFLNVVINSVIITTLTTAVLGTIIILLTQFVTASFIPSPTVFLIVREVIVAIWLIIFVLVIKIMHESK